MLAGTWHQRKASKRTYISRYFLIFDALTCFDFENFELTLIIHPKDRSLRIEFEFERHRAGPMPYLGPRLSYITAALCVLNFAVSREAHGEAPEVAPTTTAALDPDPGPGPAVRPLVRPSTMIPTPTPLLKNAERTCTTTREQTSHDSRQ